MVILSGAALVILSLLLVWFVYHDVQEYRSFKLLTDSVDRQACYRKWILRSFTLFTGSTLIGLALLHRSEALLRFPPEFASVSAHIKSNPDQLVGESSLGGFFVGAGMAMVAGSLVTILLLRLRRREHTKTPLLDVEPLLPRNRAEAVWAGLLSINAGLSEELFFRLLLPLLLLQLMGLPTLSFAVAALLFGLVHVYQGWLGVLATTIVGIVLTLVYLITGNLWVAILFHVLMDLNALLVRPTVSKFFENRSQASDLPNEVGKNSVL